ncbi:hypothetical protein HK099_007271 [Clydaea vesicula]|uniref:phenylalanine 4-monooxygenase n=1 Tax=Clydaea vesicula TaxID=447962 RepID=A0AAD5XXM8_9FUNG|nr:hypothetical protein HK099_007271 [Clydaea vesicula]
MNFKTLLKSNYKSTAYFCNLKTNRRLLHSFQISRNVPTLFSKNSSVRLHSNKSTNNPYTFSYVSKENESALVNSVIKTTIHFSITDKVGALDEVLSAIKALHVSLCRIESRPSRTKGSYDFFIDFETTEHSKVVDTLSVMSKLVKDIKIVSSGEKDTDDDLHSVPWFPRKIQDLDSFAEKVLSYGADLDADHPGFTDAVYRKRRADITEKAKVYKHGNPLPHVEYTPAEIKTWGIVFNELVELFKTHACREHQYVFPLLVQNCGYREDNIPQLEDVSRFLKDCTGWTIRPVMGLLSSRDFLNGLAFRVFHSTQYIRHHSRPLYTPEPDVCHELLGHVPLYADPDFADFSHEIGIASLGATDEDIEKLATIYWFTVEFGLCKEGNNIKAFGAGLLSSFGELEYALSDKPIKKPFDPAVTALQKFPITEYQPIYFVAQSFKEMKEQVIDYASELKRPFTVRYNGLTQSIEVLDTKEKLMRYANG